MIMAIAVGLKVVKVHIKLIFKAKVLHFRKKALSLQPVWISH